ncbi:MAG: hypothetical protein U5L96_11470 [Owenweeksia sp.]|nr:hypothetical protein [Owenweeksia sp.]
MMVAGETCFEAQGIHFAATGSYPSGTEFTWYFGQQARQDIDFGPAVFDMMG